VRIVPVPLRRLMIYGAPELLATAPLRMLAAVLVGSCLWTAVFLALLVSGVLRVARAREVVIIAPEIPASLSLHPMQMLRTPQPPRPSTAGARPRTPEPEVLAPARAAPDPTRRDTIISGEPPIAPPAENPSRPVAGSPPGMGDHGAISGSGGGLETPVAPATYESSEVDEPPVALKIVKPDYSWAARRAKVQGVVAVRAKVDEKGRVVAVEMVRSLPMLDEEALEAARQFRFSPGRVAGRAVTVWVRVVFEFELH